MKTISSALVNQTAQDTFFDNAGLNAVRKMGRDDDPQALKAVAQQFEAMFVQQMFKSMRAASETFSEGSFLNSSESQFYQQMMDQQLSLELTKGRGMGLADVLYRQMQRDYGQTEANPAEDITANLRRTSEVNGSPTVVKAQDQDSTQAFIDSIKPYAEWAANTLGVNADALMAQAALETGWGKYVLRDGNGQSSNNLFNIKAGSRWQGDTVSAVTDEYQQGEKYTTQADFRRYNSLFESFSDYVDLLRKPRYQKALNAGSNGAEFAAQLQSAGYATDPDYARKIQSIMQRLAAASNHRTEG
ncbi:flagellar assembly peptidoglycan hydrolase FlgJ [Gilvimarinus xylanilyticus]|uniref:Peptidoglycan hydrolase FlgJ n=1 Tax=Gilvimarinus xylanilyticus TaxID=2944139 RepID=A0A9X2KSA5_9GAMM|nr:flagellar assembly peptidoglycan hydrolase FlgJ [Gilvimarinus xylanilyticus]MCP8898631.1 flagellar assembly peptidoglycan hydrolase FlgJ [Gilvimarinus xylanilyticus]